MSMSISSNMPGPMTGGVSKPASLTDDQVNKKVEEQNEDEQSVVDTQRELFVVVATGQGFFCPVCDGDKKLIAVVIHPQQYVQPTTIGNVERELKEAMLNGALDKRE